MRRPREAAYLRRFRPVFGSPAYGKVRFGPCCSQRYPHPGYAQNYASHYLNWGSWPVDRNGDIAERARGRERKLRVMPRASAAFAREPSGTSTRKFVLGFGPAAFPQLFT